MTLNYFIQEALIKTASSEGILMSKSAGVFDSYKNWRDDRASRKAEWDLADIFTHQKTTSDLYENFYNKKASLCFSKEAASTKNLEKFLKAKGITDITAQEIQQSLGHYLDSAHANEIKNFIDETSLSGWGGRFKSKDPYRDLRDSIALSGRHNPEIINFHNLNIGIDSNEPYLKQVIKGEGIHENMAIRGFNQDEAVFPALKEDKERYVGRNMSLYNLKYKDIYKTNRDNFATHSIVPIKELSENIIARYKKLPSNPLNYQLVAGSRGLPKTDYGRSLSTTRQDVYSPWSGSETTVTINHPNKDFDIMGLPSVPMYKTKSKKSSLNMIPGGEGYSDRFERK